jgi:transcriptional regulator with XRE-family HTH domain
MELSTWRRNPLECLRKLRERRGWTQAQLAEILGLDVNTVARQERGEVRITDQVARHLWLIDALELDYSVSNGILKSKLLKTEE